jgi:hypothetical protein
MAFYISNILLHTFASSKYLSEEHMHRCPFTSLVSFCIPVIQSMHLLSSPAVLQVLQFWWQAFLIIPLRILQKSYYSRLEGKYIINSRQCIGTFHSSILNGLNPGTLGIHFLAGQYNCCMSDGRLFHSNTQAWFFCCIVVKIREALASPCLGI